MRSARHAPIRPRPARSTAKAEALGHEAKAASLAALWRAIPWGSETRIRSRGGAVVLVDESAEQVPSANIARADGDRDGDRGFSQRCGEAHGAMRSLPVVVRGIGPERQVEIAVDRG